MKNKRAKLKIVRILICALLLCSFPSVKALANDATNASAIFTCYDSTTNNVISGFVHEESIYKMSSNTYFTGYDFSSLSGYNFTGYSVNDSSGITWNSSITGDNITFYFSSESEYTFTGGVQVYFDLYFVPMSGDPTPTPTPTATDTPIPSPTPWVDQSFGTGNIISYLYFFNGDYPPLNNYNNWFQPSGAIFSKIIIKTTSASFNLPTYTGYIELPFPYRLDTSKYPIPINRTAEGYNREYSGTFSLGSEDGSILYVDHLNRANYPDSQCNLYLAVITITPTPTFSPTPTITPYPSAAPAAFSTYTINFVAPNGYIVGTVRPVLSIGSSYSGAISALNFSFLDGWFSYGDDVNGEKGSFTWDYSYSENFETYLWHFSTSSWPDSESINIPVYRLDGEYPEVVPDLNNVSDLFDTIGKTDPTNFSWFYDGLQAFIDINWNWAYLMLLFPLFVMFWAFFRRH